MSTLKSKNAWALVVADGAPPWDGRFTIVAVYTSEKEAEKAQAKIVALGRDCRRYETTLKQRKPRNPNPQQPRPIA